MIYIFDSSSLIWAFRYYEEDIFPSFWKKFQAIVRDKRLTSVREVYKEVSSYGNSLSRWADENKDNLFTYPTDDEQHILQKILREPCNRKLVDRKKLAGGGYVADPFVIAKAKNISGCVVTEDGFNNKGQLKENVVSIASVCKILEVTCININNFMRKEKWKF